MKQARKGAKIKSRIFRKDGEKFEMPYQWKRKHITPKETELKEAVDLLTKGSRIYEVGGQRFWVAPNSNVLAQRVSSEICFQLAIYGYLELKVQSRVLRGKIYGLHSRVKTI